MYKPRQKKSSSWTPRTAQKKSLAKFGHFSIQPKPNQNSSPLQEIGEYSRESADRLAANVMRSLEAKGSQETATPTVQPQSESRRISVADIVRSTIPPLTPHPLTPQVRMASGVVLENPIHRQCVDCASPQPEQSAEVGKDIEQISLAASGIQTKSDKQKAGVASGKKAKLTLEQDTESSNKQALTASSTTALLMVDLARQVVGSTDWARAANRPPYGPPNSWKCNIFVYEIATTAGASIPLQTRWSWSQFRQVEYPPLASQWQDKSFSISEWSIVSRSQPGDVAAYSGHMGIVSGSNSTISAAEMAVVENDWGFRSGQEPVFRRYNG